MKKSEIRVGGHYTAKISNRIVTVRVDKISEVDGWRGAVSGRRIKAETHYHVTNLSTGRKTTFRSAAKFRSEVKVGGDNRPDPTAARSSSTSDLATGSAATSHSPGLASAGITAESEIARLEREIAELKAQQEAENRPDESSDKEERGSDPTPDNIAPDSPASASPGSPPGTPSAPAEPAVTCGEPLSKVAASSSPPSQPARSAGSPSTLARFTDERTAGAGNGSQAPHVEVPALAGTGKTTTVVGGVCRLKGVSLDLTPSPQQQAVWDAMEVGKSDTIRLSAFNTKITDVLKGRLNQHGLDRKGCSAQGIHSLGLGAVTKAFGRLQANQYAVVDMIAGMLGTNYRDARKDPQQLAVIKATEPTHEELDQLASHYDVEVNGARGQVYELVPQVLERCKTPKGTIHFDDMVWLPIQHDLPIFKVDQQIVDESQDLNRMQQALMYRAGHRIIFVGDRHQAIYGFAGADAESMTHMRDQLASSPRGCTTLPLTVTRRCGRAIVHEAQRYVPTFEAHESNAEGIVDRASLDRGKPGSYHPMTADGDMVLCRCNAPLVSECFKFLAMGRKANILGRKIGEGLVALIDKSKAQSCPDLISWLGDWLQREQANEQAKRFPSDGRMANIQDRHDCLITFCSGLASVEEVKRKINSIFTDNKQMQGVTLSSIHKSKGLEARHVFVLRPKGIGPRRDKMQPWELEQEDNLSYVAITRAIEHLTWVS